MKDRQNDFSMHRRRWLFTFAAVLFVLEAPAGAFTPSPVRHRNQSKALTAKSSTSTEDEHESKKSSRRDLLGWFRRAAVVGAGTSLRPLSAPAAEDSGRIVEFTVSNLKGQADQSGTVRIQLEPSWAPRGVQRFEDLTAANFWKDCRMFRVLPGFVCQFGIQGNPAVQAEWRSQPALPDDPVRVSNTRGTVVFATAGPNTRTTQLFINTADNAFLDRQGFSPIGRVVSGMEHVDEFYAGYGEGAPAGRGPNQSLIQMKGNAYLEQNFPKLSYIASAKFVE